MTNACEKTIEQLIHFFKFKCSVEEFSAFKSIISWLDISRYFYLSEDFMTEFQERLHWDVVSEVQRLSENFIRECKDKVSWTNISYSQILSEDFIIEFKDRVNWEWICTSQTLSNDFIEKYEEYIVWHSLIMNYNVNLSNNILTQFEDKIKPYLSLEEYNQIFGDIIKNRETNDFFNISLD